jgi:hypothetical protein
MFVFLSTYRYTVKSTSSSVRRRLASTNTTQYPVDTAVRSLVKVKCCISIYIYVYIHINIYIYIYTYVYIHTIFGGHSRKELSQGE